MSETLYRKYRPKNFAEVIGQTHIVRTLSNSVKNGRIGQAYLFTGPRGTGKTSIARILAKTVNCEKLKDGIPCEKCAACQNINSKKSLDIIEIDAASNTGVDNIRDLRDTVAIANASLRYKVYIIDEVHMLSTGAFNALLKTLEEPPAHVIFILATTEIHKVPETILSRCQRFDFERLPIGNIIEKLELIAKSEKVKIEKEALEMIAISAEGGMRDAESLLGQVISLEDKNITAKVVQEILGTADRQAIAQIVKNVLEKDPTAAIAGINKLLEDGYDLAVFNKSFVNFLRQIMLIKIDSSLQKHFSFEVPAEQMEKMAETAAAAELPEILNTLNLFLEAQGKIAASVLPQLPLEIAIIKATHKLPTAEKPLTEDQPKKNNSASKIGTPIEAPTEAPKDTRSEIPARRLATARQERQETNNIQNSNVNNDSSVSESRDELQAVPTPSATSIDMSDVRTNWKKLLIDIRPYNHSLSVLLSNCQPMDISGNSLTLATPYDFYRERLDEHDNKLTVEKVFSKILGSPISLSVTLDKSITVKKEETPSPAQEKPAEQDSLLDSALEIMGGKVVEE